MKRTIKITEEQLDRLNELYDGETTASATGTTNKPTVSVQTAQPKQFGTVDSEAVRKQIENGNNVTVNSKPMYEGRKRGTKIVKLSELFK